ncbi:hypothetical protein [Cellulophaga sp. Z1A5H]|nr:hypothetical protein [Cellulophaga sp. Z1A5H]
MKNKHYVTIATSTEKIILTTDEIFLHESLIRAQFSKEYDGLGSEMA